MAENGRRLGFVGDGQLGRMMTIPALELGFNVSVLGRESASPSSQVGALQIVGDIKNNDDVRRFAEGMDIVSYEIEHIATKPLVELAQKGKEIHPAPETLAMIQDKLTQKKFLQQNGIPVAPFMEVNERHELFDAADQFGYPMVLKDRRGGYDGHGNYVIHNEQEAKEKWIESGGEDQAEPDLYVEKYIPFKNELAIMVARGKDGSIETYPVVRTVHARNICLEVVATDIDPEVAAKAKNLAIKVMSLLEGQGVVGIEMFQDENDEVLINEIAPRVHNSGHYTKEACATSQFEQHVRAVSGLPLGSPEMIVPAAAMVNILGERNGETNIDGLDKALLIPGVSVTLYGKSPTKVDRKMGHVVAVANSSDEALHNARTARAVIAV